MRYMNPEYSALPSCLLTAWPLSMCGFVVTCCSWWTRGRQLPSADLPLRLSRAHGVRPKGSLIWDEVWPWAWVARRGCGVSALGVIKNMTGQPAAAGPAWAGSWHWVVSRGPLQPQRVCDLHQPAARSTFGTPGVTEQAVGSAKNPPLAGGGLPGRSLPLPSAPTSARALPGSLLLATRRPRADSRWNAGGCYIREKTKMQSQRNKLEIKS